MDRVMNLKQALPYIQRHRGCTFVIKLGGRVLQDRHALLRLADAVDRQHAGVVRDLEASADGDTLQLRPTLAPGQSTRLTLEAKAVASKGALFAQLFGLEPVLVTP